MLKLLEVISSPWDTAGPSHAAALGPPCHHRCLTAPSLRPFGSAGGLGRETESLEVKFLALDTLEQC